VSAQEKVLLKLIVTIPMPGFAGDVDHFGLDLRGNRLFDLRTGQRIHSIEGFGQPLMTVYLPE